MGFFYMKKLFTLILLFLAVSAMAKPQSTPQKPWKLAVRSDVHLMAPQLLVKVTFAEFLHHHVHRNVI